MYKFVLVAMTCIHLIIECDGGRFLFFHSPEPMSHATILHTVSRYGENERFGVISHELNNTNQTYVPLFHIHFASM